MNEYGGCLWFETKKNNKNTDEIGLDCGRSAIQYIINTNNYHRVWLPIFNCPSVFKRINIGCNVCICDYNIDSDFLPIIDKNNLKKGDLVVWINYWGCMSETTINRVASLQKDCGVDVLIDNCMAFFCKPLDNIFNVYSCRKFIGVPDGAFIKGRILTNKVLELYETASNYLFLLEAIEKGSSMVYDEYLKNESRFDKYVIPYAMPELTGRILSMVDYEYIKQKRKDNFRVLDNVLGKHNQLLIDYKTETPYVYPFFNDSEVLRKNLLDNHIFVSQHWKHILKSNKSNYFEKLLADKVIPLPIDQRYDEGNMIRLAKFVLKYCV